MMPVLMQQLSEHQFDLQLFAQAETLNLLQYGCPWCRANDRTRLYAMYLRQLTAPTRKLRMLDIAPSRLLQGVIRELAYFEYRSADLLDPNVDDSVDVTDMAIYADHAFDCFICSHVLEHVPDDRKAIRELYRVLAPGGWGIAMAPVCLNLSTTIEDVALADKAERLRRFGQEDHVRLYGQADFRGRLADAGFIVNALGYTHFGPEAFWRHGISQSSVLYICEKSK